MATIRDIGKGNPKDEGILHPMIRRPREFMDKETLEINWEELKEYMLKHQRYWRAQRARDEDV